MSAGVVIIGTGQAGFQTAASLRTEGYLEPITLIGEEPHIPYQRPPLSKGFALGTQDLESVELRPAKFYVDHEIDLLVNERAVSIDRANHIVTTASGKRLPYRTLVLATGGRNRVLDVPGVQLDGILYLRSLSEAITLKERFKNAHEVTVIGGGFVGLELAAVAATLGKSVTVFEMLPRLMSRLVAPIISDFFCNLHRSHGVKISCNARVSHFTGTQGKVEKVALADGSAHPTDLVLVGIGILPNVELARDSGLNVANGISVNEHLQTSGDNIYAIGDCAEHLCIFAGARVRLESVQNAANQAQCVAATIAGRASPYRALPWFWTDQFNTKLQMAGISHPHDRIVTRGSMESGKLSVFYFRANCLVAVDSINRPLDHMISRKLLAAGTSLTPEQAADENVDLKKLAQTKPTYPTSPPSH